MAHMRMNVREVIVLALVFSAAYTDLRRGKIPNKLITAGYALGLLLLSGVPAGIHIPDIAHFLFSALWPIILWYPLFMARAFGAGDIKLFSVISVLSPFENTLKIMALSIVIGAVYSLITVLLPHWIKPECEDEANEKSLFCFHCMHFAPCIAGAYIFLLFWEV